MHKNGTNKYTLTMATIAVMLLTTTTISMLTENAFAYKKNEATAQTNDCGNGELPLNVGCQNTASQIQGDENSVALASEQFFD